MKSPWRVVSSLAWMGCLAALCPAGESLIKTYSGHFDVRHAATYSTPATALVDVNLSARGWFHSVVEGSPGIFDGPNGNSPYYHYSTRVDKVGTWDLHNFQTTNIESPPVITQTSEVLPNPGTYPMQIVGPTMLSFEWGDFIYGDAQDFTARAYFDPSPVADGGPAVAVQSGNLATLQASASDVDGDALTYSWSRLFGPGLSLSSDTALNPTFTAPAVTESTTTRMQLVVSDAHSSSLPVTVDVLLYPAGGNIPPLVNAGADTSTPYGQPGIISGSASQDLDGSILYYSWTAISDRYARISDATSASPGISAWDPAHDHRDSWYELVVSDGLDMSAADTTKVRLLGFGDSPVPVGPGEGNIAQGDGSVPAVSQIDHQNGTPPATLDIAGISVPGAGRLRTEVIASPALFNGPDGNNPHFHLSSLGASYNGTRTGGLLWTPIETAPITTNTYLDVAAGGSMTLRIAGPQALSYTFYDYLYGEAQSFTYKVWYRVANRAPVSNAGPERTVYSKRVTQLDGQGSSDPDTQPLSYNWYHISGPGGTFSNSHSPAPLFEAPFVSTAQDEVVGLTVSDGSLTGAESTTVIHLVPEPATPTPTVTPSPSPTATPSPSPTASPTSTPTPSRTATPTPSPSPTPTTGPTPSPTRTPTPTASPTPSPTPGGFGCGSTVNGQLTSTDEDYFGDGTVADTWIVTLPSSTDVILTLSGSGFEPYVAAYLSGSSSASLSARGGGTGVTATAHGTLAAGTYTIVANNWSIVPLPVNYTLTMTCGGGTATATPSPTPAPTPSNDPAIVLTTLNSSQWESVGLPAYFSVPVFWETGGLGISANDPVNTFGFWQTKSELVSPSAGRQRLTLSFTNTAAVSGKRHPEVRVRVFRADNRVSKMGLVAETAPGTGQMTPLEIDWISDGSTPWRIAIDLLSFAPDSTGGLTVTSITNQPIN